MRITNSSCVFFPYHSDTDAEERGDYDVIMKLLQLPTRAAFVQFDKRHKLTQDFLNKVKSSFRLLFVCCACVRIGFFSR